ncbi:phage tail tape measure protein [Liquorilactobacillus mali]|uniref:phage tail tape measure protein n=1 Tax=Liquorilactobacillus mali TaxID=1618 RepID=UPI00264C3B04|nr:phage tail tape measure protein [Liquorilactobacillus mali]MDN7145264.1 phage tail tape measure protein [Liquorilactobacillus mali]
MVEKIQGYQFSIDLDDGGMARSMQTIRNEAKLLKSEMQTNFAEIKSGEGVMAAFTQKVKDAQRAIDAQKTVIEKLRSEQSGLDQTTEKGRQAYLKYESQIESARRSITSLEAQQKRAKESLELQQSGVLKLKESVELAEKTNNSYVAALKANGQEYASQKARLTGLADIHSKMRAQLEAEKSRLTQLGTQYDSSSKKYQEQVVRVNELTAKYKTNETEIKKLNSAVGSMSDRTVKVKDTISTATSKIKDGFSKVKTAAVAAGAGVAILGAAAISGAKKASTLQNEYKVTTNLLVTGGEKAAEATKNVAQMQSDGQKYAVEYGKSQKSIAEQYQELVKRGYSSKEALGAMRTELQASVASGDDFSDVVKVSSQVLDAFGQRTSNTAKMTKNTKTTVNELAYAADMTATDFQSLGKGMEYVGDTAHNAGFSLAETSAAMGELSNHGLEADKAGTGLRKTIVSLASPSDSATAALEEIGIKSTKVFKDSNGNFKSLSTILGTIGEHTANLGSAEKAAVFKAIFGTTGMQAAQILATNSSALEKLTEKVQKAGNSGAYVATLAKKNSETAQQSEARFKQAWSNLTIMFGSKLLPYMTDAANDLSEMFNDPKTIKGIENAASGVATIAGGILKVGEYALKHTEEVKTFAGIVATIWAVDKLGKFVGNMQNLKALFSDSTKRVEAETAQVEIQTQAYEDLTTAKGEAAAAGETGSVAGSTTGSTTSALTTDVEKSATKSSSWDLLGKSVAGRIINGAGLAFSAWDIGSSVYKAGTSKNSSTKYAATGKAVGGGIGLAAGAVLGGPMGAWIGEQIGSQLGSTKVGKSLANKLMKGLKTSMAEQEGATVTVNGNVDKVKLSKNVKSTVKTINKTLQKANTLTISMGVKTDSKSLTTAYNSINKYYSSLEKLADKSSKKRTATEKAFLQAELKNGDITKAQYNKLVDSLNKSDTNRTKANKTAVNNLKQNNDVTYKQLEAQTKAHENNLSKITTDASKKKQKINKDETSAIKSIQQGGYVEINGVFYKGEKGIAQVKSLYAKKREKIDKDSDTATQKEDKNNSKTRENIIKSFAASRIAEEKKLGVDVAGELTSSSKKQKAILTELKNSKGKISEAEAKKLITESANAANKQIDDAENTYKSTKASAEKKANSAIEQAEWMYKNVKGYSKSQETAAIDSAKNERDVTIAAAKTKRDDTEATAKDQNKQVKNSAADESKSVSEHAVKSAKNGVWAWRQHVGGIYDVLNWIAKAWNTLVKDFGGESKMKGISTSYPSGQPNISMGSYATGSDILKSTQNALVGEAGPEIAYKPYSGTARIVGAKGAEMTTLEAGEKVLNASDTSKVLAGQFTGKLPAYATGSGTLTDFMNSMVSKVKNFTGNISKTVQGLLDNPESVVKKITDKITGDGKLGNLGDHLFSTISGGIENMLVNSIKKIADNYLSVSDNPSGSGVTRWKPYIEKAAKVLKVTLSGSDENIVLKRIKQESNGSPTITNNWDSNAKAGHPSIGLLQYIQPTLDSWVPKGVKPTITNGYTQLLAGFNDSNFIKDISVKGGWGPTGHKRMANGGIVSTNQMIEVAEGNVPEAVVPLDLSKRSRAYQVMSEALNYFGKTDNGTATSTSTTDATSSQLDAMISQNKTLLAMFSQLLGLNNDQLTAIKAGAFNKKDLYKEMAEDMNIANIQGW